MQRRSLPLALVFLCLFAGCSPRDFLTRRLAADLIAASPSFRTVQEFWLRIGVISNKEYLSPEYLVLQHAGWISGTAARCPPAVVPPPCWDVVLTPIGVETFRDLIASSDVGKQYFRVSTARRELVSITGISKNANMADVDFTWKWVPLNEVGAALHADSLDELARDFWNWRAAEQPISTDDIPRLVRPDSDHWVPDWSPAAASHYRQQLEEFETRWKKLDPATWPIPRQVDYRLIGSAISRVHWELDLTRNWQRNPLFYVDQSLGAYFHLLLQPPPFDANRTRHIVETLASIPRTMEYAKQNLTQPVRPFAGLALDQLQGIRPRLLKSARELKPGLNSASARDLASITDNAIAALHSYRDWLTQRLSSMSPESAV